MSGRGQWQYEIKTNVESVIKQVQELQGKVNNLESGEHNIRLDIDDKKLKNVISNLDKMLASIGKGTGDFKEFENLSKQLNSIVSEVQSLNKAFGNINDSSVSDLLSSIKNIDKSIASLSSNIIGINKDFGNIGKNADSNVDQINNAKKATEGLANVTKELAKAQNSSGNSKKLISSMQSDVKKFETKLSNLSIKPDSSHRFPEYQRVISELDKYVKNYSNLVSSFQNKDIIDDNDIKNAEELKNKIEGIIKETKKFSAGDRGYEDISASKVAENINRLLKENTAISKKAKESIRSLYEEAASGKPSRPLKEMYNEALNVIQAERAAGNEGKRFLDIIKDKAWYGWAAQLAGMFSLYDVINIGKQGVNVVRELDTALTEMRKVSNESIQSLENYQATTFDMADDVGTTARQIQESTADYMRLGESLDSASESAKDANILLNVSEFDNIEDATQSLVAMGQAYKDLDKIEIVDKMNEVGNNYAISTDELATGLQKSAATLSLMGNTLDEAAAMVTTANSTIQDADSVSAGLRTISLRVVGTEKAQEELSAMDEEIDAFVVQTNSKKQQIIKDYTAVASNNYKGFDILDDNGNYKNTYEILLGIAKVYKEIQEQDKKLGTNHATALIEELAGKNRSNIASAILQDPTQLEAVKKSSEQADGSAQAELDKYLDSIDGKIAQLQNRLQEFASDVIDSGLIKWIIDFGTGAVKILDSVVTGFDKVNSSITSLFGLLGEGNSSFGTLGAISGLLMNKAGIGERTMF